MIDKGYLTNASLSNFLRKDQTNIMTNSYFIYYNTEINDNKLITALEVDNKISNQLLKYEKVIDSYKILCSDNLTIPVYYIYI